MDAPACKKSWWIRYSLSIFSQWKEHGLVFNFNKLPQINLGEKALSFIVPLLALPQITHYILDGFIWKIKEDNFKWNNEDKQAVEIKNAP